MSKPDTRHYVPHLDELVTLLDEVVRTQAGGSVADAIRRIRRLAVERRVGMPEAEQRLIDELQRLDLHEAAEVIRAFTMYFDLANLAEDLNRVQTLRQRSRRASSIEERRRETLHDAIGTLKNRGFKAGQIQELIHQLRIEPVFTAHPSEAKRRTTRQILRRMRATLADIARSDTPRDERPHLLQCIRADLTAIWQSDLVRPRRPRVMSEVERGLFFAGSLWEVVPQIARDLREALALHYPDATFDISPFLRFGTWIGGDRDGHPFVTTEITAAALDLLRQTALEGHLRQCEAMAAVVVLSDRHTHRLQPLESAMEAATRGNPVLAEAVSEVSESEIGRQWLKVIEHRLRSALAPNSPAPSAQGYATAEQLAEDVSLLVDTLLENGADDIVTVYLQPWLDTVKSFGFHFASMDIRQHSDVHTSVVDEVMRAGQVHDTYADADDHERVKLLSETFDRRIPIDRGTCTEQTEEMLKLFELLAQRVQANGLASFGGYVISMTHQVSDVWAVLWLWRQAWMKVAGDAELPSLPIVPLFETVDDLDRSTEMMANLWQMPAYRRYLDSSDDRFQMVMIGYSDSTKDGGYLAAAWNLHQAQRRLAELAERHAIRLVVFHGRGGALGRGGGPAARAVLSLPPESVNGAMRVTEQGEILAERYDDPEIAFRHLEQVTWATLLVSAEERPSIKPEFEQAMQQMAETSFSEYRQLVTHPAFLDYFESATPVSEIEGLPIGSRPARRGEHRSLGDLRAIPWTFAWTQSRHLIPAWYSLGTAIRQLVDDQDGNWPLLYEMYDQWPFFSATIDNAELALAKSDIDIAHSYSSLCDHEQSEQVWERIQQEYYRSCAAILLLKQQNELLERTKWLQRSIRARNPSVDPLNLLQIRLLRESRASREEEAPPSEFDSLAAHVLRLSIHGTAAGLRTTG